jgi:serine/threonine protein phosphatase PrpC
MKEIWYKSTGFFILLFFIILLILLFIRECLTSSNEDEEISIGNDQTIGKRKEQEDSFATTITENGVMAVLTDGMGGYSRGKQASSIAVNIFNREFSKLANIHPVSDFFIKASNLSNKEILEKAKGIKTGTTLASVIISEGYLYWASIGDSAIALFRNGEFINLNQKHIFEAILQEQYLTGKIPKEEVLNNPMKKRLTSYIGHDEFKDIEISKAAIKLRRGDKIILCSDGVYNSVSELEMEKVLLKNIKPHKAAEDIINLINDKNYLKQDNGTIVILEKND